MIELTPEMRAAVKRRMGVPDGQELDPWMGAAPRNRAGHLRMSTRKSSDQ